MGPGHELAEPPVARYNGGMIETPVPLAPDLWVTLRLANAALHARTPAGYGASASWKPVWS